MKKNSVYIIAEAGVNHDGELSKAIQLIDQAKNAGADAVKFQTFKASNIVTKYAKKANYQQENMNTDKNDQLSMLKKLELSEEDHYKLLKHSQKVGIEFLSTPFDTESADFLNSLGMKIFKLASGEITNLPLLKKISSFKRKVIMSTGMANLKEVEACVATLIEFGQPKEEIIILHCNTEYPTPFQDVNLTAMLTIKNATGCQIGYSDHTEGIEIPIAAVTLGATVIEKHYTLDKSLDGPDHKASLNPEELKSMIIAVRKIELALGTGIKEPSKSEIKNMINVRKSIVAKTFIKKGELFTEQNLTTKRPASGISPMRWNDFINKHAEKDFEQDEMIK